MLVVWRLDRLARDVFLSEVIHAQARRGHWPIEAVKGHQPDNTPEQVMMRVTLSRKRITASASGKEGLLELAASCILSRHLVGILPTRIEISVSQPPVLRLTHALASGGQQDRG